MRRAQEGPGVPTVDAEPRVVHGLGPGNTNPRVGGGWVVYYPSPPTYPAPPRVVPSTAPAVLGVPETVPVYW